MKKLYIQPKVNVHSLMLETAIVAASPILQVVDYDDPPEEVENEVYDIDPYVKPGDGSDFGK